jgi:hypothetical protein
MTATALISGKLHRTPERKTSSSGKTYVSATLREGSGDGATWWKILCFGESAGDELMRLGDGESVAVSGAFKVELGEWKGEQRLSHTIFADAVISARPRKKEKKTEPATSAAAAVSRASEGPDDAIPF